MYKYAYAQAACALCNGVRHGEVRLELMTDVGILIQTPASSAVDSSAPLVSLLSKYYTACSMDH